MLCLRDAGIFPDSSLVVVLSSKNIGEHKSSLCAASPVMWRQKAGRFFMRNRILRFIFISFCISFSAFQATFASTLDLPEDIPRLGSDWSLSPETRFTFAILGDRTGGGLENWPLFDRAVDEINLFRPAFVIMAGDLIQGYTTDTAQMNLEWTEFIEHADRLQVPLFVYPGNHDISNPVMYEEWRRRLGRTYYSFEYGGCLFLLLNTHEHFEDGAASLGREQCKWAIETIQGASDMRHVFVFLHVPLWYAPHHEWDAIEKELAGRDYTVIAGHLHKLSHETRFDRTYLVHGPDRKSVV